jgi:hypothetical protein
MKSYIINKYDFKLVCRSNMYEYCRIPNNTEIVKTKQVFSIEQDIAIPKFDSVLQSLARYDIVLPGVDVPDNIPFTISMNNIADTLISISYNYEGKDVYKDIVYRRGVFTIEERLAKAVLEVLDIPVDDFLNNGRTNVYVLEQDE